MTDVIREVSSKNWLERMGQSFKSVLAGGLFFIVAFPILWWNEGRTVKQEAVIQDFETNMTRIEVNKVDSANEGKPVYATGSTATSQAVKDADFGIESDGVKIKRTVEVYCWIENKKETTKKKLGGGEETITEYSYTLDWKDSKNVPDSSRFHATGYANPVSLPFETKTVYVNKATIGEFTLTDEFLAMMSYFTGIQLSASVIEDLPAAVRRPNYTFSLGETVVSNVFDRSWSVTNDTLYYALNVASPIVGDLRVKFQDVKNGTVSILARQTGSSFAKYESSKNPGYYVCRLDSGVVSPETMIASERSQNALIAWILRLGGFLLMAIGIGMIFKPVAVLGDVVPFIGSILRFGIFLFAVVIAGVLSLLTIAVAWFAYRPVFAITLIASAIVLFVVFKSMAAKKQTAATA